MSPRFLFAAAASLAGVFLALSGASGWSSFRPAAVMPAALPVPREAAVLLALETANPRRAELGLPPLRVHPGAQLALDDCVTARRNSGGRVGIHRAFAVLRERLPRFVEWSGFLVSEADEAAAVARLREWDELPGAGPTHLAVHLFDDPDGGVGCLAVLGREVPRLRLPMLCYEAPEFYDECRRCGHGQILPGWQGASALTCPECEAPYDLLGADADGRWRRATDFVAVRGPVPERAAGGLDEVAEIWKEVAGRYRYRLDVERVGGGDSWNLPEETLRQGWGDCDDTAILLAHLLLARGHEARVVLGRMHGKGHAWVVVRVGGQGYLLESTLPELGPDDFPPRIEDVALEYDPEWQFDGGRLYFKRVEDWTGRYWDEALWWTVDAA